MWYFYCRILNALHTQNRVTANTIMTAIEINAIFFGDIPMKKMLRREVNII